MLVVSKTAVDQPDVLAGTQSAGPAVSVGARIDGRDGLAGWVLSLVRDSQSHMVTHFVIRTRRLFGRDVLAPVEWATRIQPASIYINAGRSEVDGLPAYRTDEEITSDAELAIRNDSLLRQMDLPAVRVAVRDGVVTLEGHVSNRSHRDRAEEAIAGTRGVRGVQDNLVSDSDLVINVAQALGRDPRTAPYYIQVSATRGIVHLTGTIQGTTASFETQEVAREIAANVAGVRSCVGNLFGVDDSAENSNILTRIGLPVYAADGELGRLAAVVMGRRSRLVTHFVVAGLFPVAHPVDPALGPEYATRRLLVPVAVVTHATPSSIHLRVTIASASQLPEYHDDEYAVPGLAWQSTFDYRREDVRVAIDGSAHRLQSAIIEPAAA